MNPGETADSPKKPLGRGRAVGLLVLLCAVLYLPGLFTIPPLDRDESRFAQASRQMIESGDYLTIRFQETPRNKKPIGIYWLQAASGLVFREAAKTSIWPYRLPSALGATLTVLLTFFLGRRFFGTKAGLLAGALLAVSLLMGVEAHQATTDACLSATTTLALACMGLVYTDRASGRSTGVGVWVLFWAALGAGVLLKGPVSLMVAGLTLVGLYLFDRDWTWFGSLRPKAGLIILILMVLPFFLAIGWVTKGAFYNDSLGGDLLPKLISGHEGHAAPPGLYLLLVMVTFWPGSLFLPWALGQGWAERARPEIRFLLAWLFLPWLFFEWMPTKLPHYVLPMYPALALLVGAFLAPSREPQESRPKTAPSAWGPAFWTLISLGLGAGIIAAPIILKQEIRILNLWPALVAVVVAGLVWRSILQGRVQKAAWAAILGGVLVLVPFWQILLPGLDNLWLTQKIHQTLNRLGPPSYEDRVRVVLVGYHEPSAVFTLGTPTRLSSPLYGALSLARRYGTVAIVDRKKEPEFRKEVSRLGLKLRYLDCVTGYNYSRGRWMKLNLYALEGPEPRQARRSPGGAGLDPGPFL